MGQNKKERNFSFFFSTQNLGGEAGTKVCLTNQSGYGDMDICIGRVETGICLKLLMEILESKCVSKLICNGKYRKTKGFMDKFGIIFKFISILVFATICETCFNYHH